MVLDLPGAQQCLDVGGAGAADAHDVHAMRRLRPGRTVVKRCAHGGVLLIWYYSHISRRGRLETQISNEPRMCLYFLCSQDLA